MFAEMKLKSAAPTNIYDTRVLRQATVCKVLFRSYLNEARTKSGDYRATQLSR